MPAPEQIEISAGGAQLRLSWPHQPDIVLAAGRLRAACKCAPCVRARFDGDFPRQVDDVAIADVMIAEVATMGNFGLNMAFSDGHRRGIYPWPYLREIAASAGGADLARTWSRAI
jgi:DUF971 family protein